MVLFHKLMNSIELHRTPEQINQFDSSDSCTLEAPSRTQLLQKIAKGLHLIRLDLADGERYSPDGSQAALTEGTHYRRRL